MRKYFFTTCLLALFYLPSFSQNTVEDIVQRKVDSLKKVLKNVKGNARIDCLNSIAYGLFWIWEDDPILDSACMYTNLAYQEAKKAGYKRGLGYASVNMEHCEAGRADTSRVENKKPGSHFGQAEKYAKQAIEIGTELNDNRMIGDAYNMLEWLEKWRGDREKSKTYLQMAISYYEKPVKQQPGGTYDVFNYTDCMDCRGNEFRIGEAYMELSNYQIIFNAERAALKEKAISYYQKAGAKSDVGDAYLSLADIVSNFKNIEAGIDCIKKAISSYHENEDENGEFKAYIALCDSYFNLGDFENGLGYSKKSVLLAERLSRTKIEDLTKKLYLHQAYLWVGKFYSIANDFQTAFAYMRKADYYTPNKRRRQPWAVAMVDLYRLTGNYDSAMYYMNVAKAIQPQNGPITFGNLYVSMKEYDKALETITTVFNIVTERNNLVNLGKIYTIKAKAYYGKNDYLTALTNARTAFALSKKTSRNLELMDNCQLLSDIFNKLGKNDSAYIYLKQYTILKDSLLNKQLYIRLNDYKKEAEEQKISGQIKLLQKDNLIKEQQLQQQILLQQKIDAQIALLNKNGEIKDQRLLIKDQQIQIKDQSLKEQLLLQQQKQSQLTLLDKGNKLKDQQLKQQSFIKNALLGGLFLLLLLGIFVFRWLSVKQKNERLQNEKKQAELQHLSTELEMQALRAQMNPHFIFNCLSSINKFILKNESRCASDYLTRFSRLIRKVLTNSQLSMIPLSDEIETLKLYLDMERLRFDNAFDYNIIYANTIEPETLYIPPMLLQPFCENAIWHGLMHKDGQGKLEIEMRTENDQLFCTIADNGVGREKAAVLKSKSGEKQKSYGLKITADRLALFNNDKISQSYYYSEDVLDEQRNIAGTRVHLVIKYKDAVQELINA